MTAMSEAPVSAGVSVATGASASAGVVAHTTVQSSLGDLTVVSRDGAITGLYFPHHWHMPDRGGFGQYREAGFDEIRKQLGEYLAGERRDFDVPVEAAGALRVPGELLDHHRGPQRRPQARRLALPLESVSHS